MTDPAQRPDSPSLSDCDRALAAWLGDESGKGLADGHRRHLNRCARCREQRDALARDRGRLVSYFATMAVPSVPALEFKGPLDAASGYPRRISLTLVPFLLALLLICCLTVIALGWLAVKLEREKLDFQIRNEAVQVHVALRKAKADGVEISTDSWVTNLFTRLKGADTFLRFDVGAGGAQLLDPYAHPYQLRREGQELFVYSCGPNGIDEEGQGDDIGVRNRRSRRSGL